VLVCSIDSCRDELINYGARHKRQRISSDMGRCEAWLQLGQLGSISQDDQAMAPLLPVLLVLPVLCPG
jgi:hypothetical protein